jgi:phenylacetate-coenzyme A ligase PaaK-like adenylate-forming protein
MASFDTVLAASSSITLQDVEQRLHHLADGGANPGRPWRGRWWMAATAGSTGQAGVFVWQRSEWPAILASYARAIAWADVPAGLLHRLRMAVVSSLNPTHQSAVVGASLRSPLVSTLRLDARQDLTALSEQLNAFQPDLLVGYASALRPLALAQAEGTLGIHPRAVMSSSEALSRASATDMTKAWGHPPFNVYAATETAGIASTCRLGAMHLYDDLVLAEPVDGDGAPVPPGTLGARLLVTVLFSRTLPLIRYEMSDRIAVSPEPCSCGLPYRVLQTVNGRAEDTLVPPSATAPGLHIEDIRALIEQFPIRQWQLDTARQEWTLRVVAHHRDVDLDPLRHAVLDLLRAAGLDRRLAIRRVDHIERSPLGKSIAWSPERR